jgi:hypothetical protein
MWRQVFGGNIEGTRGKGLFDGNIDAADPGPVHAHVSHQISSGIDYRNVHGLAYFRGLFFGCGNNPLGIL